MVLVVSVVALGLAASAAAIVPTFKPAQIAGNWKGTWHNVTFGSNAVSKISLKKS
jgi:hypothetical protein